MYRQLFSLISFIVLSFNALAQEAPPAADTFHIDERIFTRVDVEASFPGGAPAWKDYIIKNLKANVPIKKKAPVGSYMVIVRFIVAKDGSISDVTAETSHGYGMEQEVIRIIKKGPRWTPASQNGYSVNAYRRQPVTFVVQGR